MRLAIVLVLFAVLAFVVVVIGRGLIQSGGLRSPEDDWAPLEAVVGRKFLSRTARSRRRWVRDAAGTQPLVEATKRDVGYALMIDGKQVGFSDPRGLDRALESLVQEVRADGASGDHRP